MSPAEALQAPIPHDLPLPLPIPREVLLVFLVLSFLLHILFVNLMVGGSFLSCFFHWRGWRRGERRWSELSRVIDQTITVNKSLAVVLGVGPLLAMNLAYTLYFYTANALTGIAWILVVPLVTLAFLLSYGHKYLWGRLPEALHWGLGAGAAAIFAFVPLIFLANTNLMLFPERWPDVAGFVSALLLPNVLVRYLHFLLASMAATGLFLVGYLGRREQLTEFSPHQLSQTFYRVTLVATLLQWTVGPTLYFSLPSHGVSWRVTATILSGALLSAYLVRQLYLESKAGAEEIGRRYYRCLLTFGAVVLLMGSGRHFYREDATRWHRNQVAERTREFQEASRLAREQQARQSTVASSRPGQSDFEKTCAACHQVNGQGLPGVFPPLAGSEWVMEGKPDRMIAIVMDGLDGLDGPVQVRGQTYNGQMPSHLSALSDEQVSAILTYVRQSWGNQAAAVSPSEVARYRSKSRGKAWSQTELGRP